MFQPINGFTKAKILEVLKGRKHDGPSVNENRTCLYKSPLDGNRCAVGMFLPEGHDGESYIGPVSLLLHDHPDLSDKMPLILIGLEKLQAAHDNLVNGGNVKAAMIDWVEKNVSDDNPDQTDQSRAVA